MKLILFSLISIQSICVFFPILFSASLYNQNDFRNKDSLSVRLIVKSNYYEEEITSIAKQLCSKKHIHVFTDNEVKELADKHFMTAYRSAGGDGKTMPDPIRLNDALKSTDSFMECFYIIINLKNSDSLIVNNIEYSYGKYPVSKNIKKINYDISEFPDKSITPIIDSLLNVFLDLHAKKKI